MGIEPKTLEKKGYSRATAYSYNRKLPAIRKRHTFFEIVF